jgi:hypothetical protein
MPLSMKELNPYLRIIPGAVHSSECNNPINANSITPIAMGSVAEGEPAALTKEGCNPESFRGLRHWRFAPDGS